MASGLNPFFSRACHDLRSTSSGSTSTLASTAGRSPEEPARDDPAPAAALASKPETSCWFEAVITTCSAWSAAPLPRPAP